MPISFSPDSFSSVLACAFAHVPFIVSFIVLFISPLELASFTRESNYFSIHLNLNHQCCLETRHKCFRENYCLHVYFFSNFVMLSVE